MTTYVQKRCKVCNDFIRHGWDIWSRVCSRQINVKFSQFLKTET
nr:MAG TPA: hypothetical protein [Caudoviricetes sp.]